MPTDAILCIDQGTTNSKAVLIDHQGRILARGSAPLAIHHPRSGWVEQSPQDIWASVLKAIAACVAQSANAHIIAVGVSNQRESVTQWDAATGDSIGPAITWQCRRTTEKTAQLKANGHQAFVLERTGLPLDPLFPALKMRWLLDIDSAAKRCLGTIDSWLIWKLTGGQRFATDRSNASRTQLLNVRTGTWDEDLCALFGVDSQHLPTVTDSSHPFGLTLNVPGLPDGIPIASAIGDSHAALFGHAAFQPGEAKATFGTGSSVMMVLPEFNIPTHGMTTTIAWSLAGDITYALEGNILVSASLFPWAATLLGLNGDVDRLMSLAESVDDTDGVAMVPALVGLGAPHWAPDARGQLTGLGFSSTPGHIARAAALSMPLQVVDVCHAMYEQSSAQRSTLYVDGGPTGNRFLMQQLADLLDQAVCTSESPELSALGAGMLAGLAIGFWSGLDEFAALDRDRATIRPAMGASDRKRILTRWNAAVRQCLENH